MVYDGRPSKGCETCRKRRIKCDTARPTCGQCTRSRRECFGYRDETDLFFRSETHVTALRVKRAENRKNALERREIASSDGSSDGGTRTPDALQVIPQASRRFPIPPYLAVPMDVSAINGFFGNFVLSSRHPKFSPGHLQHLPSLYRNSNMDSALVVATISMAFAARSLFLGYHQRYTALAWRAYGRAITKLHQAINDPIKARQNATLMAIMVIGSTECLLATPSPAYARSNHIDGAVALLRLRGKELINDEVSTSLFLNVRTHMLLDRIQRSKPPDAFFHSNSSGWQPQLTGRIGVNTRLTHYTILMPALRQRANQLLQLPHSPSSIQQVTEFIYECKTFDLMLASWPSTIPQDWHYMAFSRADETMVKDSCTHSQLYPGDIDIYYDGWVACVWNAWRCTRMFVNALILRSLRYLAPSKTVLLEMPDYIVAKDTLQQMVDEVCSSVPYHIGYDPPVKEKSPLPADFPGLKGLELKALASYFLLWPLFVARSAATVPSKQRIWLRGRMMAILARSGTVHAKWLVEIGDEDETRPLFADHWDGSKFENIMESSYLYASGGV